jgi:ubiquinone/menaquinone biosynthesis C-methylase UbiE
VTRLAAEFEDCRLLEVYDAENLWGPDDEWFMRRVEALRVGAVADLGCGTGRLAVRLPEVTEHVTAVDPSAEAIARAQRRLGSEAVTWVVGDAVALGEQSFDVVLLTSHVAQFFVSDDDWSSALASVSRALKPGGQVLLDSRDPAVRGWEAWDGAVREVALSPGRGSCLVTTKVQRTHATFDPVVELARSYVFSDGTRLESRSEMRFRRLSTFKADLARHGMGLTDAFGGWAGESPLAGGGELVLAATRSDRLPRGQPGLGPLSP